MEDQNAVRIRVHVDPQRCSGSGLCIGLDPDRFAWSDGVGQFRDEGSTDPADLADIAEIAEIAACCPNEAIIVETAGQ